MAALAATSFTFPPDNYFCQSFDRSARTKSHEPESLCAWRACFQKFDCRIQGEPTETPLFSVECVFVVFHHCPILWVLQCHDSVLPLSDGQNLCLARVGRLNIGNKTKVLLAPSMFHVSLIQSRPQNEWTNIDGTFSLVSRLYRPRTPDRHGCQSETSEIIEHDEMKWLLLGDRESWSFATICWVTVNSVETGWTGIRVGQHSWRRMSIPA